MEIFGIKFRKVGNDYVTSFGKAEISYHQEGELYTFHHWHNIGGTGYMSGPIDFSSKEEGFIDLLLRIKKVVDKKFKDVEHTYTDSQNILKAINDAIKNSEQLKDNLDIKDILE